MTSAPMPAPGRARFVATAEGHVDAGDIDRAVAVDAFGFAMEVTRAPLGLRLDRVAPG